MSFAYIPIYLRDWWREAPLPHFLIPSSSPRSQFSNAPRCPAWQPHSLFHCLPESFFDRVSSYDCMTPSPSPTPPSSPSSPSIPHQQHHRRHTPRPSLQVSVSSALPSLSRPLQHPDPSISPPSSSLSTSVSHPSGVVSGGEQPAPVHVQSRHAKGKQKSEDSESSSSETVLLQARRTLRGTSINPGGGGPEPEPEPELEQQGFEQGLEQGFDQGFDQDRSPGEPSTSSVGDTDPQRYLQGKKKRTRTLTTPHQSAVLHALLAQVSIGFYFTHRPRSVITLSDDD